MDSTRFKLSVMMFLEFFIWGAWLPLIFGYLPSLGFTSLQASWVLNAFAIASFVGMFFSNQFADRNFSAERFLAVSHLIGGVAILLLTWTNTFWPFFLLMLVHCMFYVPTISITNAVAFANLTDPQREFGPVRLWGTIGWIAASWPFVFILVDWAKIPANLEFVDWLGAALGASKTGAALQAGTTWTFFAAGMASLVLAVFSLTLPHTPPKPVAPGGQRFAWLEATKLLAVPYIFVLFVVTFFDAAVHQGYFILTNDFLQSIGVPANWVMPAMSIGQFAEIGTMALLGACLKSLGWRNIMVLGILGHTLRFGVFALLPISQLAIGIIVVHGICYAFFFATVYIFVDEFLPKDARSSAQGLFNFLILGVGPFVGNFVWPQLADYTKPVVLTAEMEPKTHIVRIHGRIDHLADPSGTLTLSMARKGESEAIEQQIQLKADQTTFEVAMGKVDPGTYKFEPISVIQKQIIVGDKTVKVTLPELTIPDELKPDEVPKVNASLFDFQTLFLFPSATALLAAIALALFFRPPAMSSSESMGPVATPH